MIVGIDEAGRGCLCGPVCACAVLFKKSFTYAHVLADSKSLTAQTREELALLIRQECYYGIGWVYAPEIDVLNIHHASLLAMSRAFDALETQLSQAQLLLDKKHITVLIDGKFIPPIDRPHITLEPIIKGDTKIDEIKAASILAKTSRDYHMKLWDRAYPMYGLSQHKGYPTPYHKQCIALYGSPPLYRQSFKY